MRRSSTASCSCSSSSPALAPGASTEQGSRQDRDIPGSADKGRNIIGATLLTLPCGREDEHSAVILGSPQDRKGDPLTGTTGDNGFSSLAVLAGDDTLSVKAGPVPNIPLL